MPSNTLSADVPTLGWWFGGPEPNSRSVPIWSKLVDNMGAAFRARLEKDPLMNQSGLIVDTPSAFTNATLGQTKDNRSRYPLLQQAVDVFDGKSPRSVSLWCSLGTGPDVSVQIFRSVS